MTTSLAEPPYPGQLVPGLTPERFARGIVSTDAIEFNGTFSPDGSWSDLVRLDDTINTPDHEWCPMITPDSRYLFFSRLGGVVGPPWAPGTIADVYWVDARVLDRYRAAANAGG